MLRQAAINAAIKGLLGDVRFLSMALSSADVEFIRVGQRPASDLELVRRFLHWCNTDIISRILLSLLLRRSAKIIMRPNGDATEPTRGPLLRSATTKLTTAKTIATISNHEANFFVPLATLSERCIFSISSGEFIGFVADQYIHLN
jgi:hypothetical protein